MIRCDDRPPLLEESFAQTLSGKTSLPHKIISTRSYLAKKAKHPNEQNRIFRALVVTGDMIARLLPTRISLVE